MTSKRGQKEAIITDGSARKDGLNQIGHVHLSADESRITFCFDNGSSYSVELSYLRQWYRAGPHQICDSAKSPSVEIDPEGDVVTVKLRNGSVYHVAWDVILMACEPRYEHFGGFTDYSKTIAADWLDRRSSRG